MSQYVDLVTNTLRSIYDREPRRQPISTLQSSEPFNSYIFHKYSHALIRHNINIIWAYK